MEPFKFKKLEIKDERSWIVRLFTSALTRQILLYCFVGAVIGYILFFLGQDGNANVYWNDKAAENVFIGLGFGIFLSTSPCARGRC